VRDVVHVDEIGVLGLRHLTDLLVERHLGQKRLDLIVVYQETRSSVDGSLETVPIGASETDRVRDEAGDEGDDADQEERGKRAAISHRYSPTLRCGNGSTESIPANPVVVLCSAVAMNGEPAVSSRGDGTKLELPSH
jgi:hypothetical protein